MNKASFSLVPLQPSKDDPLENARVIPIDQLAEMISEGLKKNAIIKQSEKKQLLNLKKLQSFSEILDWIKRGKHIGLRLDNLSIVCLDVDNKGLANMLFSVFDRQNIRGIITTSPRGAHFFFRVPEGIPLDTIKSGKFVMVSAGFLAEYRTDHVTFLGNGYSLVFCVPQIQDLPVLPRFLWPMEKPSKKYTWTPILSEQNDYQIGVGQRNSALFTLGCQLRTAWRETWEPEIVLEVLKTVNNVFFQEPLVHDEVETIFTSVMKRPESTAHEKLTGQIIANTIKMKYEGLLFCTTRPLQWYDWNDGYWRETPMVVLESLIFTEIREINEEFLKSALVNEVKFVLERDLAEETRERSGKQNFLPFERMGQMSP